METTPFDWEAIAEQVDRVAEELRAADRVPAAVEALLDDLPTRMYADRPQSSAPTPS